MKERKPSSSFDFETRYWPLVLLTLHDQLSDDGYRDMFARWEEVLDRGRKFAAVTDARKVKERAPPTQREMIADWTRRIEPRVVACSVCHVTVIDNAWIRGAMTAIEWLHKPKVPSGYFATVREACDFAVERLDDAGVPISFELRAFRASLPR